MNPFLHSTVARPQTGHHRSWGDSRPARPAACPGRRRLLAAALGATGLAAIGWSGGALAVDLNTATEAQLQSVRGIGPKTAGIILEERQRGGPYESFSDLSDRVRGIGPKKAASLQAAGLRINRAAPSGAARSAKR
ncbi:MAG: helix-hairpin-helix domain-containing protein [Alcaligenaceae bacterium]|nr:helix-hairpin-helix domain-containing protein [Alcaligenaceae bacterium]